MLMPVAGRSVQHLKTSAKYHLVGNDTMAAAVIDRIVHYGILNSEANPTE